LLPCNEARKRQRLEEDNLNDKSPDPPGWGLRHGTNPSVRGKTKKVKNSSNQPRNGRKQRRPKLRKRTMNIGTILVGPRDRVLQIEVKRKAYNKFLNSQTNQDKTLYKNAPAKVRKMICQRKNDA